MSYVTNVIFTCSTMDDELMPRVAAFDNEFATPPTFADVGGYAAGGKAWESVTWLGAFNYLQEQKLAQHVLSLPWRSPNDVRIFIQRQNDDRFSLWNHRLAAQTDEVVTEHNEDYIKEWIAVPPEKREAWRRGDWEPGDP